LVDALRALDRELSEPCDVVLFGGAAMILHFDAARATADVDALLLAGDGRAFRRAVENVASKLHLPRSWLNDAVKGFADLLPDDFRKRLAPLELGLRCLTLLSLGRPDLLIMKLAALREQDLEDIELLLSGLAEDEREVLVNSLARIAAFRPDWALKMRYFLQEQGWAID
jgi:hypothetical protein